MKKNMLVLLCLALGVSLALGPANVPAGRVDNATDSDPTALDRPGNGEPKTYMDPPETVWTFDCEFESVYNVGVTSVQDSLCWVSAGQVTLKIGVYNIADPSRPFRYSFAQTGGPSGWGIRDMAYDPNTDRVYAGFDNQRFHAYNATTRVPFGTYTISGYTGTVRAMAWHPMEDSLWTANFTVSPMTKFSITGTNARTVKPALEMGSCYGLAWDDINGCFWSTNAGAAGTSPMWKITYPGYAVVDSFNPVGWDLGGGCEMWRDTFLLALEQGTPDMIWCLRMVTGSSLTHDVALQSIVAPGANVNPGANTPQAQIRNAGSSAESNIPVTCWIDSAGNRIYSQTATYVGPLAPSASATIDFAPWNAGPAGSQYAVTMFTGLATDENRANDTARVTTRVSGAIFADTIVVARIPTSFAPVINGVIDPTEWSMSQMYDISDILNRSGSGAQPPGTNIGYYMYDDNFMYYAMDVPNVTTRADYDQFGPYMDENNSGTWSTDSSEGNYWMEFVGADSAVYRALLSTAPAVWLMGVAPDAQLASSLASGNLQFEAKVPFGSRKSDYTVSPGGTVRYFQYTATGGGNTFLGWWPQSLTMANWANPAFYGPMVFSPTVAVEQEPAAAQQFSLYRVTSPVKSQASVRYYVGRTAQVSLGVFDAAGKLVRQVEAGTMAPGVRTATWDRTNTAGQKVAGGTYFFRLTVDGKSVTAKSVVLD